MSVIRQYADTTLGNTIWTQARALRAESARRCPGCGRGLKILEVDDVNGRTELDGCVICQFFWFDNTELTRLGIVLKLPPAERRRAVADLQVETLRENRKAEALAETVRDLVLWWYWTA
jgi:hypothetical protein